MRVYYLFKINDTFSNLYFNKSFYLYKMLEDISKSSKNDFIISYRLFEEMATSYDKTKINNMLENTYRYNRYYNKNLNRHYYNDGVEKTKLTVYNTFIKIRTNHNISCFFENLVDEKNVFVCDFNNKDYFWLDKVINKACIK